MKVVRPKLEFGVHLRCRKCKGKGTVFDGGHQNKTCPLCQGAGYTERDQ